MFFFSTNHGLHMLLSIRRQFIFFLFFHSFFQRERDRHFSTSPVIPAHSRVTPTVHQCLDTERHQQNSSLSHCKVQSIRGNSRLTADLLQAWPNFQPITVLIRHPNECKTVTSCLSRSGALLRFEKTAQIIPFFSIIDDTRCLQFMFIRDFVKISALFQAHCSSHQRQSRPGKDVYHFRL